MTVEQLLSGFHETSPPPPPSSLAGTAATTTNKSNDDFQSLLNCFPYLSVHQVMFLFRSSMLALLMRD
jgi:hypothetical protein